MSRRKVSSRHRTRTVVLNGFRITAACFLLAALVVAPWLLGGATKQAQFWIALPLAISALLMIPVCFDRPERNGKISPLAIWGLLLLSYGCLQLMLPGTSPFQQMNNAILADTILTPEFLTTATPTSPPRWTLAPHLTQAELPIYVMAFSAFVIGGVLSKNVLFINSALFCLTLNGLVFAFLGMYQKLRWDNIPYGFVKLEQGGIPFAAFINRNNACAYLLVIFALGICFLLRLLEAEQRKRGSSWRKDRNREIMLGIVISLFVMAAGILASLSRGGILSLVAGVLVTLPYVLRSRSAVTFALSGLFFWWLIVGTFGWHAELLARFWELDQDSLQLGRVDHWKHTLPAIYDFCWFGTGLGTYSLANRPYQTTTLWFTRADNQYVEYALELGLLGCSILLIMAIGVLRLIVHLLKHANKQNAGLPFGVFLLFVVASQATHGLFDYGLTLPPTLLTLAMFVGVVSSRSMYYDSLLRKPKQGRDFKLTDSLRWRMPRPHTTILLPVTGLLMLISLGLLWKEAAAEQVGLQAQRLAQQRPRDESPWDEAIARKNAENFEKQFGQHVVSRSAVANLNIWTTRVRLGAALFPESTTLNSREWRLTDPLQISFAVLGNEPLRQQLQLTIEQTGLKPLLIEWDENLDGVLESSPLSGRSWRLQALSRWLQGGEEPAWDGILQASQTAAFLRPFDEDTQLLNAMLLAEAGRRTDALTMYRFMTHAADPDWKRIWESGRRFYEVSEIASEALPENPAALLSLLQTLAASPDRVELAEWYLQHASPSAESGANQPTGEQLFLWGLTSEIIEDMPAAQSWMEQAIQQRPLRLDWRLTLIRNLLRQGNKPAAQRMLDQTSRLFPGDSNVEKLFREAHAL